MAGETTKKVIIGEKQLDRIEQALLGNGREGLIGRTARLEEKIIATDEAAEKTNAQVQANKIELETALEKTIETVNTLAQSVASLSATVDSHIKTDHLSSMIRKKGFWAFIVVGFVTLHLISTYIPSWWDAIMIFLGIPKLVIPLG